MNGFLKQVATHLFKMHKGDISKLTLVFPNRRGGIFFINYLNSLVKTPLISPKIITINELFSELSPFHIPDRLSLIFRLYKVYCESTHSSELFDDFYFWGEMLISDFDQVDKYLVNAHDLFTNVTELKEIDVIVLMACDLQEPPELIAEMIRKWEEGNKVVVAVKSSSRENPLMYLARKLYYKVLGALSDKDRLISNFTGYGLYDRVFLNVLRKYQDPSPYLRGFVSEIGFKPAEIPFVQEARKHGNSKHNFFSLYNVAMSGLINHSKMPLRLAVFCGFFLAGISLLVALGYLVYKLLYWKTFALGLAPLIIGVFFFSAVQLIFIGVIGEYVGAILSQVKRRPYAVIEETINCPNPDA